MQRQIFRSGQRFAQRGLQIPKQARPRSLTTSKAEAAKPEQKPKTQGPITWKVLAICGAVGTAGLAYYSRERERRMEEIMKPKTIGKAAIGGPFELVNASGKPFTEKDLEGRWTLIYFGFTMCPDICPEELTKVSEALQTLEKRGKQVAEGKNANLSPFFITIDPERDTTERADEYAKNFHEAFVGLGGSAEQIAKTAKQFRVYYSRDDTPGDEYLVDHSIITYLMDPKGEFAEFYGKNTSAVEMAARIEAKMLAWKPSTSKSGLVV